jgi:hypothetical protein
MSKIVWWASCLVGNYFLTTLNVWFGHWSSHLRKSPTFEFHVGGHHALYPDSCQSLSHRFLYGSGRHDSLFALLPPLLVQAGAFFWLMQGWLRWTLLMEMAVIVAGISCLHAQFHIGNSRLKSFDWFQRARQVHFAHHDREVNFMVGDHFWDRIWHTYEPYAGPQR